MSSNRTYLMEDKNGKIVEGVQFKRVWTILVFAPEYTYLKDSGRVKYMEIIDEKALETFYTLTKIEGIGF